MLLTLTFASTVLQLQPMGYTLFQLYPHQIYIQFTDETVTTIILRYMLSHVISHSAYKYDISQTKMKYKIKLKINMQ